MGEGRRGGEYQIIYLSIAYLTLCKKLLKLTFFFTRGWIKMEKKQLVQERLSAETYTIIN